MTIKPKDFVEYNHEKQPRMTISPFASVSQSTAVTRCTVALPIGQVLSKPFCCATSNKEIPLGKLKIPCTQTAFHQNRITVGYWKRFWLGFVKCSPVSMHYIHPDIGYICAVIQTLPEILAQTQHAIFHLLFRPPRSGMFRIYVMVCSRSSRHQMLVTGLEVDQSGNHSIVACYGFKHLCDGCKLMQELFPQWNLGELSKQPSRFSVLGNVCMRS